MEEALQGNVGKASILKGLCRYAVCTLGNMTKEYPEILQKKSCRTSARRTWCPTLCPTDLLSVFSKTLSNLRGRLYNNGEAKDNRGSASPLSQQALSDKRINGHPVYPKNFGYPCFGHLSLQEGANGLLLA